MFLHHLDKIMLFINTLLKANLKFTCKVVLLEWWTIDLMPL